MKKLPIVLSILCLSFATSGYAQFSLQEAFSNLTFVMPVDLQHAGDGTDRIFVVEQRGVISVFPNDPDVAGTTTFLDIQDRVDDAGYEEGLLGLAFHLDYETNGYFYVYYTASGPERSVISRFSVTGDPDVADPNSELVLLEFNQPYSNHNGGSIQIGPADGYLYIGSGDGGSFGDPGCVAQDLEEFLGKILRIDVDNPGGGKNYGIPPDNPFFGNTEGYLEEIYAYGMRNPWRFSIDDVTNWLWCGDVGQNDWEEIDIIENGSNYGWAIMEGNSCYNSPWACAPPGCNPAGLTPPIWEYSHALGSSVTGGYVYHGNAVPELTGKYIYGDYISGRFWSLEYDGVNPPTNTELLDSNIGMASFGLDEGGELYICAFDGKIYEFTPTNACDVCELTTFQAKCVEEVGGTWNIKFRLVALDEVIVGCPDVVFDVNGTEYVRPWQTNGTHSRALNQTFGNPSGVYTVTLIAPDGCHDPIVLDCSVGGSISGEWVDLDLGFDGDGTMALTTVPAETGLIGNYPNPFNPSTTISYALANDGFVSLKIYNTLGQEIATLVNEFQTAGSRSVTWDAGNTPGASASSGFYFVRLTAGDVTRSSKILLMK